MGRAEDMARKLRRRNRRLSGNVKKVIGEWRAGDKIPKRKLTTEEKQYIGKKRHEAALKKWKKKHGK